MCAQGDIESVAGMSPKALTEMLEKVSGSGAFRKDYEALEAAKGKADEKVAFLAGRKKVTNAEKRQKKEQKEEAEKHLSLQRELVHLFPLSPRCLGLFRHISRCTMLHL
jgi:structural maintenance of chromosome 1